MSNHINDYKAISNAKYWEKLKIFKIKIQIFHINCRIVDGFVCIAIIIDKDLPAFILFMDDQVI